MTRTFCLFPVCTLMLLLTACGGPDLEALQAYTDAVRSRPPEPPEPPPVVEPVETVVYSGEGRRDPFTPGIPIGPPETRPDIGVGPPPPDRRKEELERFPLDSLSMVGTLDRDATRWALIETPEDVVHRVHVGNYLGRNHGQIVNITPERIRLTEMVEDRGEWRLRDAEMALRH